MSVISSVTEQLRRSVDGGPWHGPALADLLSDVDAETARERPVPSAHSIWEIVLHISGWHDVVRRRLEGESVEEPDEGDWPDVGDASDAAWQATRERLAEKHSSLLAVVGGLQADASDPERARAASDYEQVIGQLQHVAYHSGQIAILKKRG